MNGLFTQGQIAQKVYNLELPLFVKNCHNQIYITIKYFQWLKSYGDMEYSPTN